jgi:hypothetical protein
VNRQRKISGLRRKHGGRIKNEEGNESEEEA